jgi:hypothetical protein
MNTLRKWFNRLTKTKKKTTIYDLNIDCLKQVINKLSLKEVFGIERVDKRFQLCVKEVLKEQKALGLTRGTLNCKHTTCHSCIKVLSIHFTEYYADNYIVGDKITGPFQTFISFLFVRLLQLKKCQIKA